MFGVKPRTRAARLALEIYGEVLGAVHGGRLVASAVRRVGDMLFLQDAPYDLASYRKVFVCGAGKASVAMASALLDALGDRCAGGLVIAQQGFGGSIEPIKVRLGAHPIPDEDSILAGEAMLAFAAKTEPDDLLLFCLSGGSSALMEALRPGIALPDLRATTDVLLRAGADIRTLNSVRAKLSRVKAGGLARACRCHVAVLVLSDVIGHDVSVVGSGPFLAAKRPASTEIQAHAVALGFEGRLPQPVLAALTRQTAEQTPAIPHHVVGSAALLWPLASEAAAGRGLEAVGYADPIRGEARLMAGKIMRLARVRRARGDREFCMVLVGEATVAVRGDGRGGRAQEMATQAAGSLVGEPEMAFLAAGTDGADGPTEAAGGVVDCDSVGLARASGQSVRAALHRNDTTRFLQAAGGLIVTGPTHTNVNDVVLVIHAG